MFSNSFKKFCDDSSSAWIQHLYWAGKRESSGNRLGNGRMREGGGKERRYERTWKRGILATSNGIGLYRNQEREQKETGGGGCWYPRESGNKGMMSYNQRQHESKTCCVTCPSSATLMRSSCEPSSVVIFLLSFIVSVTIFPAAKCNRSVSRSISLLLPSSSKVSDGKAENAWSDGTNAV